MGDINEVRERLEVSVATNGVGRARHDVRTLLDDHARLLAENERLKRLGEGGAMIYDKETGKSEKPVASIKMLARYEPDTVYIGNGGYVAECVCADDGDYYLAADVDAAIAELRAEVDAWKRVADAQAERHGEAEARADRLAEALRDARRALAFASQYLPECNEPYERANRSLAQEDRND